LKKQHPVLKRPASATHYQRNVSIPGLPGDKLKRITEGTQVQNQGFQKKTTKLEMLPKGGRRDARPRDRGGGSKPEQVARKHHGKREGGGFGKPDLDENGAEVTGWEGVRDSSAEGGKIGGEKRPGCMKQRVHKGRGNCWKQGRIGAVGEEKKSLFREENEE